MSRLATGRRVNFTVLIPARLASTRLPDKPLADIAGAPMVVRVAQQRRALAAPRAWSSRPTTRASSTPAARTACRRC